MSGFTDAFKQAALANWFQNSNISNLGDATGVRSSTTAGSLYVALHTASPGDSGNQSTNECSYTGYARVALTRASGAGGFTLTSNTISNTSTVTFGTNTGSSQTATHWSIGYQASGSTNATIVVYGNLATSSNGGLFEFTANDTATDTIVTVAPAYSVNDTVCLYGNPNATLPTGVTEGTVYFIKTVTGNVYTLSTTAGGATLDITAVGSGLISRVNTSSSAGYVIGTGTTPSFAASALTATLA